MWLIFYSYGENKLICKKVFCYKEFSLILEKSISTLVFFLQLEYLNFVEQKSNLQTRVTVFCSAKHIFNFGLMWLGIHRYRPNTMVVSWVTNSRYYLPL